MKLHWNCLNFVVGLGLAWPLSAQTPQRIWLESTNGAAGEQVVYFRKTFRTPPLLWNSRLALTADDEAEAFLNGVSVARCDGWTQPVRAEITVRLNQGENVLAVRAKNRSGPAGLLVKLDLGGTTNIVTDSSWLASTHLENGWSNLEFSAAHWERTVSLGTNGIPPWGDALLRATATPVEAIRVPPGFKVELLRSAEPGEGSWVCFTFDNRGRLIISPEGPADPLRRVTLRDGKVDRVEPIGAPVHFAMGLLWSDHSLYANAHGPEGNGLYRLIDANGDDQFGPDELKLLQAFQGAGEHGYHAIRLGPDGHLYILNGNGTKPPPGLASSSPHRNYAQDVLSLNADEVAPGPKMSVQCHVLRTDSDGRNWELWAGGMRNAYAFDFSPEGELFTFDSDMEWAWGTPWYRPTRIIHLVPGGEYGWRDETRSWPDEYEDSLPPVLNVGIGSPTGVRFATKSRFPDKYRRALFAMDWSYGRIFAVQLYPKGAGFGAACETFLRGTPLNLTDLDFGPDGALYFVTGGRGTQSGLYRVSWTGAVDDGAVTQTVTAAASDPSGDRRLRRRLERSLTSGEQVDLEQIWDSLGSPDRSLRFAARLALEAQDLSRWKERALRETRPTAALVALLALARVGGPTAQASVFENLARFDWDALDDARRLIKLRVLEVSLARQGRPAASTVEGLLHEFDPQYPAASWPLNRELSRMLIYLGAPGVIPKTLDLLALSSVQEEQFHYVAQLRNFRSGWTLPDRKRYLEWWLRPRNGLTHPPELRQWFADVGRSYVDGAWLDRYLREFRADALAGLSPAERPQLAALIDTPFQKALLVPGASRSFVRQWTMSDLLGDLDQVSVGRNFERGRQAFVDGQCLACHRLGNDGAGVGPELTSVPSKYDRRSILESILEPSKVVSEQYQNSTVVLKSGDSYTGRLVRESPEVLVIETDPVSGTRESLERNQVETIVPSNVSPMPEGLVNTLTRGDILDLLAYLESTGQPGAPAFHRP